MKDQLLQFKKTFITLAELEQIVGRPETYEQFAAIVQDLVNEQLLQPVRNSGNPPQSPQLYYKYKILKHSVKKELRETIERLQLTLHERISLDAYYRLTQTQLEQDLPYIEKIHTYLMAEGLPTLSAPAPERSQQIMGDEKWIQYKGGRRLLERLSLWADMQIVDVKEPLRFALNPQNIGRSTHYHLIVENKTTYEALLPALSATCFTTLIYGAGFEIVGSLSLFPKQLPLPYANHIFYYFGDIDFAGISIWYLLNKQQHVELATPFYEAALTDLGKPIAKKQLIDEEAIQAFMERLHEEAKMQCQQLVEQRYYVSQEVLTTAELQQIWQRMSAELVGDANGMEF